MHLKLPGDSSNIHTINPKECTVYTTYSRLDLRIFVSHGSQKILRSNLLRSNFLRSNLGG